MNVDYKEIIRPKLTPKRYFHSLCVAEEAVILAEKYGCDTKKAYVAGILHDIMKDISREEMLKMFKDFDIILTDVEKQAPKLWHAILGSEYIRRELKIDDEEADLDALEEEARSIKAELESRANEEAKEVGEETVTDEI